MELVKLSSVTKSFGAVRAVDALDLSLGQGEILGFLGTNGAGKTTTIKMLLGLIAPDAGGVAVFGADPRRASTRRRIGFMPETAHYYPFLTARELLRFYGGLCGMDAAGIASRAGELLEKVGLAEAGGRQLKTYSKGMLQRAGIAQALLHDPDLLILDEPFTGLDPLARIQFRDLLLELRAAGKTVFFSSHELSEAELICDRVAILKAGRCVYEGSVRQIAGDGGGNLERIFLDVLGRPDAARKEVRS
ncbi:MAG: ABC transporter ATP-binding protein [Kiritimatiellae bacterium]|jgi:ABC-2 type transport system ATP-binding protein|nr:ABC transporter ATP-binding protein [Kiritimatiellia bacterium]NLE42208.1 ABC transporter ATP-binding protein [Lentisphaerota bacterium]